jgi:hypothetical protein
LFETIARGEFNIRGFQNKHLRQHLSGKSGAQTSAYEEGTTLTSAAAIFFTAP